MGDCKKCPFYKTEPVPEDLAGKVNLTEWSSCDVDAVGLAAADRIANQLTHIAALQMEIEKLRGRLMQYEDTELTPEEIDMDHEAAETLRQLCRGYDLGRLVNLAEADKDGRVVALPCKVGDTLFRVFAGEILEHKVRNMRYLAILGRWDIDTTPFCSYVESSIGKTIFLTHEEAEAALEAMKDVCP